MRWPSRLPSSWPTSSGRSWAFSSRPRCPSRASPPWPWPSSSFPWATAWRALAQALGLAERVRFLGARQDVAEVLAEAQVFALATHWEGLPLSVLEAMRSGLPVVATDVGGVKEAVVEGETGFLVGRGDEAGFRERLARLLQDPRLRASLGEAGRKRYEEAFTLERMLRETWRLYEEILG
jgi:glycosyltransferase involved in cell wall biosynthesis